MLCSECRAIHDHPPFHCQKGLGHLQTLGKSCCECDTIKAREDRRAARNAPLIAQLQEILNRHMEGWHKPWPGAEFGKAIIGNSILNAIRELGGTPSLLTPGGHRESYYDRQERAQRALQAGPEMFKAFKADEHHKNLERMG